MTGRRDPLLLLALASSLALLATVVVAPGAFWRLPLAVLGGVWAPGYALVGLVWRRGALSALERHALGAAFGLLLVPLAGLLASESLGFTPSRVAIVIAGVTMAGVLFARRSGEAEQATRAGVPSTRATVWIATGALVLSAVLVAPTFGARAAPSALALTEPDGAPFSPRWDPAPERVVRFEARAGSAPIEGALVVTWDGAVVLVEPLALAAGEARAVEVALPADARGAHELQARWDGREVHARVQVGSA